MRTLLTVFLSLALGLCAASGYSQGTLSSNNSLNSNLNAVLDSSPSFLPVEEAFQLSINQQDNQLQLNWLIAPEYYLYKHRFKLEAIVDKQPQTLQPSFTQGTRIYDDYYEKELEVFYHSARLTSTLPADTTRFILKVQSQGCADAGLCYPPQTQQFHIDTQTGSATAIQTTGKSRANDASNQSSQTDTWLPYIILLALAGGAILNLMPCVFPVLSIKALSMAGAHQSENRQHLHGWVYTAGVVAAFTTVAALMLAARAGGQAVGWGFQLQSPLLVSLLAYLFFAMGLSLSGLVTFGTRLMGMGQGLTGGKGLRSSFFTGVLAAVVASPCTAPFMGTALGYAITQPALISLCIFAALGFGMALPFLLLSYIPQLGRYLPQPGRWMDTFKQCLAFPLYLAAVWLLWVLGRQAGSDAVAAVCVGGTLIAFAFWLTHHHLHGKLLPKAVVSACMLAALWIPFNLDPQAPTTIGSGDSTERWQPYSEARLSQLRAEGRPVFVNLTADWCLTCLANERLALHTDAVEQTIDRLGIATLKGDWTNYNAEITALLNRYGRSGVPLYLAFPANNSDDAEVLPQLLTEETLLNALNKAANNKIKTNKQTFAAKEGTL